MILINNIPAVDPNVHYHGKELPRDKAPIADVPPDENVQYNGKTLPADKVPNNPPPPDPTNDPGHILIGVVSLPPDTSVMLNGKKVLAQSQILDGVSVFEHILRNPYQIEFDIVIREAGAINVTGVYAYTSPLNNPFPQKDLELTFKNAWEPNTVQTLTNTYLNGLGILEIIIEDIQIATVRGSKNIPVKIKAWENQPGQTIII